MAQVKPLKITSGVTGEISPTADIVQLKSLGLGGAPNNTAGQLRLGAAGTVQGTMLLEGLTSGIITIKGKATAGTWTMTLPDTAGTNGFVLKTDGAGVTSWITPGAAIMAIGSAITGSTLGSVLFVGAGLTLGENNANFYWNDALARLGLGTTPSFPLHVLKTGNSNVQVIYAENPTAGTLARASVFAVSNGANISMGATSSLFTPTALFGVSEGYIDSSVLVLNSTSQLRLQAASTQMLIVGPTSPYVPAGQNFGFGLSNPAYPAHIQKDSNTDVIALFAQNTNVVGTLARTRIVAASQSGNTISMGITNSLFTPVVAFGPDEGYIDSSVLVLNSSSQLRLQSASTQMLIVGPTNPYAPAGINFGLGLSNPAYPAHIQKNSNTDVIALFAQNTNVVGTLARTRIVAASQSGNTISMGITNSLFTPVAAFGPDEGYIEANTLVLNAVTGTIRLQAASSAMLTVDTSGTTVLFKSGTVGSPAYAIGGATTGVYSPGANIYAITVAGADVLRGVVGQVLFIDGTAAAPGLAIIGDQDTGIYSNAANSLNVGVGGVGVMFFDGTTANKQVAVSVSGTAVNPSFYLGSIANSDTGLFSPAGQVLSVTNAGVETIQFSATNKVGLKCSPGAIDGILTLNGETAQVFSSQRRTTANAPGQLLLVQAGGATVAATDKDGGQLILGGGVATGLGSSKVVISVSPVGATGTTDNALLDVAEFRYSGITFTQQTVLTGSPTALSVTAGAHTSLTASVEASDVAFNLSRTVEFATGALATQRAVRISNPTYGFIGASTISDASTVSVAGAPAAGSNATITRSYTLRLTGAAVAAGTTNSYGLRVSANTGATNNYVASFDSGGVGVGTLAPATSLDVAGDLATRATTPGAFTGTQNDYAVASGQSFARLSGSTTPVITGLVANNQDGKRLVLRNIGGTAIQFNNQDAGSTAANRIITGTGANITLAVDASYEFIYDATTARWCKIG